MPLIFTSVEKYKSKQLVRESCDCGEPAAEDAARSDVRWGSTG